MKKEGYFGNFGGRFVPEALRPPLMELEEAMDSIMPSREYRDALQDLLVHYAVPTFRKNWASACG